MAYAPYQKTADMDKISKKSDKEWLSDESNATLLDEIRGATDAVTASKNSANAIKEDVHAAPSEQENAKKDLPIIEADEKKLGGLKKKLENKNTMRENMKAAKTKDEFDAVKKKYGAVYGEDIPSYLNAENERAEFVSEKAMEGDESYANASVENEEYRKAKKASEEEERKKPGFWGKLGGGLWSGLKGVAMSLGSGMSGIFGEGAKKSYDSWAYGKPEEKKEAKPEAKPGESGMMAMLQQVMAENAELKAAAKKAGEEKVAAPANAQP